MNGIKILFIFTSLYSNLLGMNYYGQLYPVTVEPKESPEEKNFQLMKTQLKSGSFCLNGDLYNEIRDSSASMKYYCQFICSLYKKAKDPNYIANRYGHRGKRLGGGSFGVVYMYTNSQQQKYAIKIPKSFKYSALFEELNASECIKKDMEPFWLKKMGVVLECVTPPQESPHLIMNYYSKTLGDKMNEEYSKEYSTYSQEKKEDLYYDMYLLAAEMRQLHKKGLAHRDFKPENAMVDDENLPILVDFGMTTPNLTNAKTMCGSPLYMDPELLTYKNTGGASADVYALGITFYIMMTGDKGYDNVESMILKGNYNTLAYNPNFDLLGLIGEKAFIKNMLISSKKTYGRDSRWTMEQVYQYLKKIVSDFAEQRKQIESQRETLKRNQETQLQKQIEEANRQKEIQLQKQIDETNRQREIQLQKQIEEANRQVEIQQKIHRQIEEANRQKELQIQQQQKMTYIPVSNVRTQAQGQYIPQTQPLVTHYYTPTPNYIDKPNVPQKVRQVPYYNPVYNHGENLADLNKYVQPNKILQKVDIYYGKPRVVRVVRYLN